MKKSAACSQMFVNDRNILEPSPKKPYADIDGSYSGTDMATNQTDWVRLRTLVLPETIKELPYSLLSYCQQLETFVCYAPLESTGKSTFMLCRSLSNAIFVNGVRDIDNYAFDGASPLGGLYFGEHLNCIGLQAFGHSGLTTFVADAETIEDNAFVGCESLTSLHLTGKVKACGEYMATECPNLTEICLDGCDLTTSEMELVHNVASQLTVRVPEDMDEDNLNHATNCVAWNSTEMAVTVTTDPCAHALPALPDVLALLPALQLDGNAVVSTIAQNTETAETEQPAASSESIPEEYLGAWYGVSMTEGGETYALADFGLEMTFTINADGAVALDISGEVDTGACAMQDGVLMIDGVPATLENGMLVYAEGDSAIILSREQPESAAPEAEPETEPANEPETEPAAGLADAAALFEKKYVMTDADVSGYSMTAEAMGGYEYSLVFHEDGTVDFVMAGTAIPPLKWSYGTVSTSDGSETDGIVIDFSGQPLNVVPTEKGFDMDYFGSMLMHFAPEDSAQ